MQPSIQTPSHESKRSMGRPLGRTVRGFALGLSMSLGLGLLSTGCVRSSSRDNGPPSFPESELNDDVDDANDFGVLLPGDHFIIRGDISDLPCAPFSYCDPFDGFAFTAGDAIHVDFSLVAERSSHDFDVCIYDPLLDVTIDCFQSDGRIELGGVDVFAGGLDFHLVVESFIGTGDYELEIEVFPLFGFSAEDSDAGAAALGEAEHGLASNRDKASSARLGADSEGFDAYGHGRAHDLSEPIDQVIRIDIDASSGQSTERVYDLFEDGRLLPAQ